MPFGIGFIFLLMLVGGVAAYWGDRVGMMVGRSRLSVLGIRPKYTSRIVAVATGVLIVLFTLTTLLILSNSVRTALFGMDELQDQIVALSTQVSDFESRRRELEESNAALEARNESLELETLQLQEEKRALQQEIAQAERELEQAREELAQLQESLETLQTLGSSLFNFAQTMAEGNFEVRAGEVLGTLLVDVTGGRDRVLANLKAQLDALEAQLAERGIGSGEPGDVLRFDRIYQIDDRLISFNEEQVLAQAVDRALLPGRTELGADSVIVEVTAVTNGLEGYPVYAEFTQFVANELVFREGEVVSERLFDPSLPKDQVFEEVQSFIRTQIGPIARSRLLPSDGNYGEVTWAEAYRVVDDIARRDRPVIVKAVAAEDTWAYDSLKLRFEYEVQDAK